MRFKSFNDSGPFCLFPVPCLWQNSMKFVEEEKEKEKEEEGKKEEVIKKKYGKKEEREFQNLIIYGPVGAAKYSFAAFLFSLFSSVGGGVGGVNGNGGVGGDVKFIIFDFAFPHKHTWHETFLHAVDLASFYKPRAFFFFCFNAHLIHSDILSIFHLYFFFHPSFHFILFSNSVSFFPSFITSYSFFLSFPALSSDLSRLKILCPPDSFYFRNFSINSFPQRTTALHAFVSGGVKCLEDDDKLLFSCKEKKEWQREREKTRADIGIGRANTNFFDIQGHSLYDFLVYNDSVFDIFWDSFMAYNSVDIQFFNYYFFMFLYHFRTFFFIQFGAVFFMFRSKKRKD